MWKWGYVFILSPLNLQVTIMQSLRLYVVWNWISTSVTTVPSLMLTGLLKWRYTVFIQSHDITWLHDERDRRLGEWNSLNQSYNPTKFGVCRPCGSRKQRFEFFMWPNEEILFKTFVRPFHSLKFNFENCKKVRMTHSIYLWQ